MLRSGELCAARARLMLLAEVSRSRAMNHNASPSRPSPVGFAKRVRRTLVLLLSCAAGGVDAASYIGLGHVFAANMTGNTVHLGMAVGRASSGEVARSGAALIGFLIGAAFGAAIVERDDSATAWPRVVTVSLFIELGLLVIAAALWHARTADSSIATTSLLLALGLAMGMQSAAVRRLRIPGVVSTYLTGTLTMLTLGLVRRAIGARSSTPEAPTHGTGLLAAVWVIYAIGAAGTTVLSPNGGPRSLLIPIVLIAVVLGVADRDATWLSRAALPSGRRAIQIVPNPPR